MSAAPSSTTPADAAHHNPTTGTAHHDSSSAGHPHHHHTLGETLKKVAGKIDKAVTGFDDQDDKKHPGELEVDPHYKAANNEIPHIDHRRDPLLHQVPAPGSDHQRPGHKQSRDHPIPDPEN